MAKADSDALGVWYRGSGTDAHLVGQLRRDDVGRIGFQYDGQWRRHGFPVSCSLPLEQSSFSGASGTAHRFFANLLPEGDARVGIVRTLRVADTDYDLLRAIGGECAGALVVLASGSSPIGDPTGPYRRITEDEIADLAARRGHPRREGSVSWPRLSLAGAQHKCPVLERDGSFFLPVGDAATSHILKFEVADFRNVPLYETYTTALAEAIGLDVVKVELRVARGLQYTVIDRFDRFADEAGLIRRLHQEDFCQALGIGHERKYETDGGPSVAECVRLLRDHVADPVIDIERLLVWQAFNWLAGNSDGHAKNLALLYRGDTVRLAPFYDLVCTRAIERVDRRLAMSIAGEHDPGRITPAHWAALAEECGIQARFVQGIVRTVAKQLLASVDPIRVAFERRYGPRPALQRIERVVVRQCGRFLRGPKDASTARVSTADILAARDADRRS